MTTENNGGPRGANATNNRIRSFPLYGRVIIRADVRLLTSLHIGGTPAGIEIGGVNGPVIRNPLTRQPYIPGSSLRGKMRSLLEKYDGLRFNYKIGSGNNAIYIHSFEEVAQNKIIMSEVCYIFGVPGNVKDAEPTRLFVRDVNQLVSLKPLEDFIGAKDRPDTADYKLAGEESRIVEVKSETAIDRVTSAAVPRTLERVAAGLVFRGLEMVYNFYTLPDYNRFQKVLLGLRLLEDDYLGGGGSRGSGRIAFEHLKFIAKKVTANDVSSYAQPEANLPSIYYRDVENALAERQTLQDWIKKEIPITDNAGVGK